MSQSVGRVPCAPPPKVSKFNTVAAKTYTKQRRRAKRNRGYCQASRWYNRMLPYTTIVVKLTRAASMSPQVRPSPCHTVHLTPVTPQIYDAFNSGAYKQENPRPIQTGDQGLSCKNKLQIETKNALHLQDTAYIKRFV